MYKKTLSLLGVALALSPSPVRLKVNVRRAASG